MNFSIAMQYILNAQNIYTAVSASTSSDRIPIAHVFLRNFSEILPHPVFYTVSNNSSAFLIYLFFFISYKYITKNFILMEWDNTSQLVFNQVVFNYRVFLCLIQAAALLLKCTYVSCCVAYDSCCMYVCFVFINSIIQIVQRIRGAPSAVVPIAALRSNLMGIQ